MHLLKTFGILLIVIAIFGAAMFALNLYTAPLTKAHAPEKHALFTDKQGETPLLAGKDVFAALHSIRNGGEQS